MGRITARTRSPDRASRVREADHRRSESGAAAAVGDWDRDFATHPADLAGGRQSIVCFFFFFLHYIHRCITRVGWTAEYAGAYPAYPVDLPLLTRQKKTILPPSY